jgi:DNA-binding transcriptional regulator YhcF (GntR family)
MRITDEQRRQTEQRIRAAADRLLRGDLPPGTKPDISTLARHAQISRATLYRTYHHLLTEFEERLKLLTTNGQHPDPRENQITRLRIENTELKRKLSNRDTTISDLEQFKIRAASRLLAQHDEIRRLQVLTPPPTNNIHYLNSVT